MTEAGLQAAAAQQLSNSLPHFTAAQGVDDGVQAGVQDSQGDEIVSAEQQCTLAGGTEEVHQQQQEQWPPADHKDPNDGDHSFKQSQGALATAMGAQLCTPVDVAVDGTIKHTNSQEYEEEDQEREKDVGLGVEREEGGASVQAANTVPAQQGEEANHKCQNPAECHQDVDPIVGLPG